MTTILLNIGLEYRNGEEVGLHQLGDAIITLEDNLPSDVRIHSVTRVESQTEPTACVELRANPGFSQYRIVQLTRQAVYRAAVELGQDAIALCVVGATGYAGQLIGPRADAWGAFNEAYFILQDGFTIAQHLNQQEA